MSTKVIRINQIVKEKPQEVFTSIYHLINYELLKECFDELNGNKATGLDKVTKDMYFMNLDENLNNLVNKLKTKSYRPSPARKVNIPKSNGKLRGIAIANFEDKIVQLAVKKLVEAIILEPKFTNNMFGFRPNKSCHDCLKYLNWCIERKYTNYILEIDIKGYLDNISHDLIMKALETHIKDTNLRLIKRFLKAGIMENGKYTTSEYGTP